MLGVRTRILAVGDVSPVHHCEGGYPLPPGLAPGTVVVVRAVSHGYAEVMDATGREWTVAFSNLDPPHDLWWRGEWIDRHRHPEGARAFACWLEHEAAEREEGRWRCGE